MTSHELARKLLEGPDLPVDVQVDGPIGTIWSDEGYKLSVKPNGDRTRVWIAGTTACYFDVLDEHDMTARGYSTNGDDDDES